MIEDNLSIFGHRGKEGLSFAVCWHKHYLTELYPHSYFLLMLKQECLQQGEATLSLVTHAWISEDSLLNPIYPILGENLSEEIFQKKGSPKPKIK